jgi:hypothetical protein
VCWNNLRWLAASLVRKTPALRSRRTDELRFAPENEIDVVPGRAIPNPFAREPCLCGSRRPFGSCCGDPYCAELTALFRRRKAEDDLVPQILAYERRMWGLELRDEAIAFFYPTCTSSESVLSAAPVFMRWFPFTWVPGQRPDLESVGREIPEHWPTASLGVTWLASKSSRVSAFEEAFIVTAARSPYSLLLIESVVPGWSLTVQDLLTGRRFRVVDLEVARRVRPEQILFSAVLTIDGVSTLMGCACHAVPSELRLMASVLREYHADGAWLPREGLPDIIPELCSDYRDACDDDSVIEFEFETYGEPRVPLLLRWDVSAPLGEMFERLRSLSLRNGEEEAIEDETGPDGQSRLIISWYEPLPPPKAEARQKLGFLYVDNGRLRHPVQRGAALTPAISPSPAPGIPSARLRLSCRCPGHVRDPRGSASSSAPPSRRSARDPATGCD